MAATVNTKILEDRLADLHTQQPGKVVTFYPETYEADVQLMCRRPVTHIDGGYVYEEQPIIPRVQVVCFGNANSWLKVELSPGDFVWVMSPEISTAEFVESGSESEPADVTRHGLLGSVAIPFMLPTQMALTALGPMVSLAGGADYVALAAKVDANFLAIKQMFTNWTPVQETGLKTLSTALSFSSTAATEVKAT